MAPAAQTQINFQCRKGSVRQKMDFDGDDQSSPTKSPRKGMSSFAIFIIIHVHSILNSYFAYTDNCDLAIEVEQSLRLTRSASRRTQTPTSSSKPTRVRASPRKQPKNLFKNMDSSSPVKSSLSHLATPICRSPKKPTLAENDENQKTSPLKEKKRKQPTSPNKLKLHHPNGVFVLSLLNIQQSNGCILLCLQ